MSLQYHQIDDKEAEERLAAAKVKDHAKLKFLFQIFKDCDGLDRVKLGKEGLNPNYFEMDVWDILLRNICTYYP